MPSVETVSFDLGHNVRKCSFRQNFEFQKNMFNLKEQCFCFSQIFLFDWIIQIIMRDMVYFLNCYMYTDEVIA